MAFVAMHGKTIDKDEMDVFDGKSPDTFWIEIECAVKSLTFSLCDVIMKADVVIADKYYFFGISWKERVESFDSFWNRECFYDFLNI